MKSQTTFQLSSLCDDQIKKASATSALNIAKYVGKELPLGIGSIISLLSAGNRTLHGDLVGAGLDVGSAIASPFATPVALGIDALGFARDIAKDSDPKQRKYRFDKEAATNQFRQDVADPSAGTKSDLFRTIEPMISSEGDAQLKGHDAARVNNLKDQVRKGMVGLEYITGLKKNTGETFYDEHPVEAVTTDALKHAPGIGAGLAGMGVLENYRRQKKNLNMTEPAQMARAGNPLDTTNPANLLDPSKEPSRADISRLFGDTEANPEKRLALLDRLNKGAPGDTGGFSSKFKTLGEAHGEASAAHTAKMEQLQRSLETSGHPDEVRKIKALMDSQTQSHTKQVEHLDKLKKKLLAEAKHSEGNAGLQKYVNLHESLRRAREKGGLKGLIGEGAGGLGGISDLLEKYHITGAHPHYDEGLLKSIISEYAGPHVSASEFPELMQKILQHTGDLTHQGSGLSKALKRVKGPLMLGGAAAAGGTGLYHLIKSIQDQSYSKDKSNEWKRTLLQSRGDFEGAKQIQ